MGGWWCDVRRQPQVTSHCGVWVWDLFMHSTDLNEAQRGSGNKPRSHLKLRVKCLKLRVKCGGAGGQPWELWLVTYHGHGHRGHGTPPREHLKITRRQCRS